MEVVSPGSWRRFAGVVPGFSRMRARIRSPSRSARERRWLAFDLGSRGCPDRWRALIDRTHAALVLRTSATSDVVYPSSVS
jgi:hypothetical protein